MVLAKLKILTVFAMIMKLMRMEYVMNGDWFYTAEYSIFNDGGKASQRSPPHSLTR